MSQKGRLLDWVDDQVQLKADATIVLGKLAQFAGVTHRSWSPVPKLARWARCSVRRVGYILRELEAEGLIENTGEWHRLEDSTRSVPVYQLAPQVAGLGLREGEGAGGRIPAPGAGMGASHGCTDGGVSLHAGAGADEPQEPQSFASLTGRARAGEADGEAGQGKRDRWAMFWKAEALFPAGGKGGFSQARAKAAWSVLVDDQGVAEARLVEACRRCGADPANEPGRRFRAMHTWLADGGWMSDGYDPGEGWSGEGGEGEGAPGAPFVRPFVGPGWLRDGLVGRLGETVFRGWLGHAVGWAEAGEGDLAADGTPLRGTLTLKSGFVFDRVRREPGIREALKDMGVGVARPVDATGPRAAVGEA